MDDYTGWYSRDSRSKRFSEVEDAFNEGQGEGGSAWGDGWGSGDIRPEITVRVNGRVIGRLTDWSAVVLQATQEIRDYREDL